MVMDVERKKNEESMMMMKVAEKREEMKGIRCLDIL